MVQKVKILITVKTVFTVHELLINRIQILQICSVDHIDEQFSIYVCKLFSLAICPFWSMAGA